MAREQSHGPKYFRGIHKPRQCASAGVHRKFIGASDIADTLLAAVKPLGGVQISCPDALAYRYLVVSTKGIIFGLTVGMNKIAIRLDEWMKICALVMGAVAFSECGDYWVSVQPLGGDADWPAVDLRFWALKAYAHERDKAWQITLPGWITGG